VCVRVCVCVYVLTLPGVRAAGAYMEDRGAYTHAYIHTYTALGKRESNSNMYMRRHMCTSEMYSGTRAELRPIAMPARKRPAAIVAKLVAAADNSGPASMGSAHSMKEARRPKASAQAPPVRLPSAAPASVVDTTCMCTAQVW
jgi:hypothetical protein